MNKDSAISTVGLSKVYNKKNQKIRALNEFPINIPKGSIYGLLGPNGAGKTTVINALTRGHMTSGTVTYKFKCHTHTRRASILFHMDDPLDRAMIRTRTGICPQHDVLWDQCTPREHLRFFAKCLQNP